MESDSTDSLMILDLNSGEFDSLDSNDNWLTCGDPELSQSLTNNKTDLKEWLCCAFTQQVRNGVHTALSDKLSDLELLSPQQSIDSRTFRRQKRFPNKRESLFNGSHLSTLYSPVDENEVSSEMNVTFDAQNKTFVQSNKKSLNGTFTMNAAENTFTICDDVEDEMQMNNIDEIQKIAEIQEENLRQSCSNRSSHSGQRSPNRNHLSNFNRPSKLSYVPNGNVTHINCNTLTKNQRDSRYQTNTLMDDFNDYQMENDEEDDQFNYQNGYSPDLNFNPPKLPDHSSTPLVSRPVHQNYTYDRNRGLAPPRIMPSVSNLKAHSSNGRSKIGRSEPNISKRLQPLNRGVSNNMYGIKCSDNSSSRVNTNFIDSKMPSDSRLSVRNEQMRYQNNQYRTLGRVTSPPPSQSQQQLVGKVSVEGQTDRIGTTATTNLSRKATFRVREYTSNSNSEENLRDDGIELCNTNSNTITNGYQTNKSMNNNIKVTKKISKIPGPKSIRSGIPVCGVRTMPGPGQVNNKSANLTDNSWRNGCF